MGIVRGPNFEKAMHDSLKTMTPETVNFIDAAKVAFQAGHAAFPEVSFDHVRIAKIVGLKGINVSLILGKLTDRLMLDTSFRWGADHGFEKAKWVLRTSHSLKGIKITFTPEVAAYFSSDSTPAKE
ncbi:hypothetical protein [Allohahella marinimesophila]|uniref:Uncharacterized protein n=1 Tax=Allohahella marinimesophila TaxID=1054972 RepID=A0ABP7PUT0_9GAMM